jgi:DNA-directed RNA polymerase subunit E'
MFYGEALYKIYSVSDMFKMSPEHFGDNISEVASEVLQRRYEGAIDKDVGVVVAIFNVRDISDGIIYPGDPATHHNVDFDMLTYMPAVDEVVSGEVSELVEFGAFVRIGPMEGLVHVSQIAGEFLSFDKKVPAFISKKSGKNLKKGDDVLAKISTVSMKKTVKDSKIALTMKPDGLGKTEWISQEGKGRKREAGERRGKGGSGRSRR